ncbi:heat shock 70 kda 12b [Fusarium longipes]|uniref:Heat shock 70 kDa 12b n=1 Tax=Fusarium longipes TaxID=694270 RepID=A0A395SXF6_9HYPO|nr:heat shock 70 kda 12b [Fusarium longipes]
MPRYSPRITSTLDSDKYFEKFVALGIDFGTTYTGVSWARSTDPSDLNSITGWPSEDHRNKNQIQMPTLYDVKTEKWGYQITPEMKPMKWFKLLLLNKEDINKEAGGNSAQLRETIQILEALGEDITPVQVVGLYLKKVWDHTYASLGSMMDIDNLPLRVAITVPAIWPDYAKNVMKEAAKIAGITKHRAIGTTTLMTVEEPEAAALASLFQRNSFLEINKDESFVVCDAGGGTIDVISYTVVSEQPFRLEECVTGRGKLDGAFLIDQAFFSYLKGKAKLKIKSLKVQDYNQFILREWELGAKRSFSSADEPDFYHLHPPSDAYGPMARLRKKETLAINKVDMTNFFARSLTGIKYLVGDQYREVQSETGKEPKGDKVDKESHIPVAYHDYRRVWDILPPKRTFEIMYCEDDVAPKRKTPSVLPLCRIECDWDKPLSEWKTVGNPLEGWRKHDDLEVAMWLQGEPKWMVRVGSKSQEHRFNIEYIASPCIVFVPHNHYGKASSDEHQLITMSLEKSSLGSHLRDLYRQYRQTKDINSKAAFFSPHCHQVCRTDPSYAAEDRETIIKYLLESGPVIEEIYRREGWLEDQTRISTDPPRSFYSMRPLTNTETSDFGTIKELAPAGFKSVDEVKEKAKVEKWEGLRVNMWTEDGADRGILVKVHYWWRMETSQSEDGVWKQILHDILYLGPRDGTEKDVGGEIIEDK